MEQPEGIYVVLLSAFRDGKVDRSAMRHMVEHFIAARVHGLVVLGSKPWETYPQWRDAGGYYKYLWWGVSMPDGHYSFMADGKYGQFIYVDPARRVVIVRTAAKDGISSLMWKQVFEYIAEHAG